MRIFAYKIGHRGRRTILGKFFNSVTLTFDLQAIKNLAHQVVKTAVDVVRRRDETKDAMHQIRLVKTQFSRQNFKRKIRSDREENQQIRQPLLARFGPENGRGEDSSVKRYSKNAPDRERT